MIAKNFEFLHEVKPDVFIWLMAEVEFHVGRTKREDSIKIVGEITDMEANVYELKDSILINEFYWKFKQEVEEEREEVLAEVTSKLRDF